MNILGIWDGHDSGAALLHDGELRFAVNEERLTRRKLEVCFPTRSIEACLTYAGLRPEDVDLVAVSTSDPAKTLGRLWPAKQGTLLRGAPAEGVTGCSRRTDARCQVPDDRVVAGPDIPGTEPSRP